MAAINPSTFSRKQTLDLRSAMVAAIAKRLKAAVFPTKSGGPTVKFAQVFEHWPDYTQKYVATTAAVMPAQWPYDAARLTPSLIEETWEPRGKVGLGLYALADISADFEIYLRSPSDFERSVFIAGLEQLWVADEVLMDPVAGARYGVVIEMPEYWGVCAGFALKSVRVLDDENKAMREHREAIVTLTGQATQVKLAPVRPMTLKIKVNPDLAPDC